MRRSGPLLLSQMARVTSGRSSRHLSLSAVACQHQYEQNNHNYGRNHGVLAAALASSAVGLWYLWENVKKVEAREAKKPSKEEVLTKTGERRAGLPQYRKTEVAEHHSEEDRIWVTFKHGVYDITDFVPKHPGAKNILMAAGGSLEPFWNLYAVHQHNPQVYTMLEEYRIGNLYIEDVKENEELAKATDPYILEPKRNPGLAVLSMKPFNAETPLEVLADHFYTPNEWFYVRNHLPTPDVTEEEYELDVEIEGHVHEVLFKLSDLKTKFKKAEITSAIQCGGNRRAEMHVIKPIKGLGWKGGAIGNAKWGGVRLSDILADYDLSGVKHVQFEGYDQGSDGSPYGASIPIGKAMSGDVLLAYEMNGETLPRDHGYPIRVVASGVVGARNVKWLKKIILSKEESHSHWQRNDYKGFNPSVDWDNVDFTKSPSIQGMPITSVICHSKLHRGQLELKGYAWAGGGNRVIRIDLTIDKGETWFEGKIEKQEEDEEPRHFGWSLWSASVPVGQKTDKVEVWCKAVDSNYNSQPESFENIWNLRGVNSNAYHKLVVNKED